MKKLFLFALLFAATTLFADDEVLVENFSKIGNVSTGTYTWTGDLCTWSAFLTARRAQDTIHTANQKQAIWMSVSSAGAAKVSTTNFEGGIKAVDFKYARFGSEKIAGRVLQLKVKVGETEYNTPTYANNAMKQGNGTSAAHETYSHAFNSKSNEAQLSIENISTCTESLKTSGICRICVGDITITPYLLYTTKEAVFQVTGVTNKFTNNDLINNIDEGDVVYSISENTIGATINATTGEVTATEAGEVTVTATWEGITTSYTLTILTKTAATAVFEEESYLVKINESAPVNEFTTNSTATVAYSSSDVSVATVDPATGAVSLAGIGTTVITATVPENDDFMAAEASYTIRVVPVDWKIETFDSAVETASNYANPAESTTGDLCKWTAQLGGVKHMTDASYISIFGDTKYALFRAPRQGETKVSYIESDPIEGGISSLTFSANPTAGEGTTTWDIRVFVNGVQVGENYTGFGTAPQTEWTTITIPNINVDGDVVIRFENHSTISGTYTSGNKGRLAIDNIEVVGYEAPKYAVTFNAMPEHGLLSVLNGSTPLTSGDEMKAGTVLTIAATPGTGYELNTLTVMNGETPVDVDENNQFTMPAGAVTVSATFSALPVKYYITGIGGWDLKQVAVYEDSYTFENLAAGSYALKVTDGESWATSKGYSNLTASEMVAGLYGNNDNNICFTLAEAGDVTVTYTTEVFKLAGGFVPQTVRVKGAWDDWATTHVMNISDDRKSASVTMELAAADEVEFGIQINNDDYRANGYGFKREYNTESGITGNTNMKLTSDKAGDYTFTWTFGTNTLTITFPEILVYRVAGDKALMGSDWNTGDDDNAMTLDEGIYSLTKTSVTLQANTYKFKVVADDTWRIAYPTEYNAELTIDPRGTYDVKFTFNPTTKEVGAEATYKGPVTSIDNTNVNTKAEKQLINGQLIIIKNGVRYNAQGQVL